MPNAFAFAVLFSWPVVVYLLFRRLPFHEAIIWSILGGYLLLPTRAGFDLPAVPPIDKQSLTSLSVVLMVVLGVGAAATGRARFNGVADALGLKMPFPIAVLMLVMLTSPFITVFTNPEVLQYGPLILPALRPYDAISIIGGFVFGLLPFLLAQRHFATVESHVVLLKALVLAMLIYSLPTLFEIRMSPQLNVTFYGFFPHQFLQHMRDGGFRPVVFLLHGLWLAIIFAMAVTAALALWKHRLFEGKRAGHWIFAALYLLIVLALSNSLGALVIAAMIIPVAVLLGTRGQVLVAAVLAGAVLVYPILRGAQIVPVDDILSLAESVSAERAASLEFRLRNEDALSERAAEKPWGGWGSWGRNLIFDPETGQDQSIVDGAWILLIGTYGWLGYLAQFGLMTLPILLIALGRRKVPIAPATAGLALVMVVNLVDLIPNATMGPVTWLISGALAGFYARRDVPDADVSAQTGQSRPKRNWGMVSDRGTPAMDPPRPAAGDPGGWMQKSGRKGRSKRQAG